MAIKTQTKKNMPMDRGSEVTQSRFGYKKSQKNDPQNSGVAVGILVGDRGIEPLTSTVSR